MKHYMDSVKLLPVVILLVIASMNCTTDPKPDNKWFDIARSNGVLANEGFRRCMEFTLAWLEYADPVSGLFPENLYQEKDTWNGHNSAADNYPFMVLTSLLLNRELYVTTMHQMLESEKNLTSRLNSLPDDYSLSNQAFVHEGIDTGRIIFGASEYIKDGLIPLTEYAGITPWSERMLEMLDDLSEIVSVAGEKDRSSMSRSRKDEINGELLQTLSRVYWMTGENKYLEWALDIGDHYLIEMDLHLTERIRLRDHGCEIIAGLSELYCILHYTIPDKKEEYEPALRKTMDRILKVARNEDGMFYNEANLLTGEILDSSVVDNWGYIYNAYYTIYLLDGIEEYRLAAVEPLKKLVDNYSNFNWEGGGSDGFADAIESGINLYNRESVPELEEWINNEIKIMWSLQDSSYRERAQQWKGSGIIEGWHGDGNFARTTIMYCLLKTCGLTIEPWRQDVIFGAVLEEGDLYITIEAGDDWEGILRFDGERHKEVLHLPLDYPRINQFPEWYSVIEDDRYMLKGNRSMLQGEIDEIVTGRMLRDGMSIKIENDQSLNLRVSKFD